MPTNTSRQKKKNTFLTPATANVERIQTALFSDEEKPQLPAALAAQLATTREQVADLTKEATNSPDPVSAMYAIQFYFFV